MDLTDDHIIDGLKSGVAKRPFFENELYLKYKYYIDEGCRKFRLSNDDSFSAYSDAVMSVIHNIVKNTFEERAQLKTYLFKVYSNKCIDLVRKNTAVKQIVHQPSGASDLLGQLPDAARSVIEKMIERQRIEQVKRYLDEIGENCKEILLLFEDNYTDREIAAKLEYNNAAVVKTTRLRCLEKIKKKFNLKN
ncbi:MAG: sigma-70 family RNA polymerase sigma factor [Chitinophagaceae bacterium]